MEPKNRDRFDSLIDQGLREYGIAEPRAGLEGRVLANLAGNVGRTRARSVWAWSLASACAMVLVFALWVEIGHRQPKTTADVQPNVSVESAGERVVVTEAVKLQKPAAKRVQSRRTSASVIQAKNAEPRLAQFPSPRPISEQEAMLVQYVQRYPEEAMVISKKQDDFEEQVKQAEQQQASSSSSYPQER